MNKRDFLKKLAVAAAGFTILPPATTYERIWRPAPRQIVRCDFKYFITDEAPMYDELFLESLDGRYAEHYSRLLMG